MTTKIVSLAGYKAYKAEQQRQQIRDPFAMRWKERWLLRKARAEMEVHSWGECLSCGTALMLRTHYVEEDLVCTGCGAGEI